jgi:imidazolonepropionase-like amidohydrolase
MFNFATRLDGRLRVNSVAYHHAEDGRRKAPPLAPPSKEGESERSGSGGNTSFVKGQLFIGPGSPSRNCETSIKAAFCRTRASWLLIAAAGSMAGLMVMPRAAAQPSRGALTPGSFAITGVSVVAMTSANILKDSTVLVRDGGIVAVGPSGSVTVPPDARVIDGRRKFVIPGLADMHTHLFSDEEVPDSMAADEFGVMLANGVTTIRLMIGRPGHLTMRRDIEAGRLLGPQLWVASPQLTGRKDINCRVVTTPDEARAAVKEAADAGYDFIKLTLFITPEVFEAVASEAARNGIRVVGHVDPRVGVARALAEGQHIEHLDNYMESVLADSAPSRNSVSDRGVFRIKNWESLDFVDDAKVMKIARATADARVFTTPTLTMFKLAFAQRQSDDEIRARPEWGLMPPKHRALYLGANKKYWANPPSEARRKRYIEVRNRLVKEIANAGGKIMAGSDTPEWFLGYGFTLHRELENLVAAGLTPYQALESATRNPAEFLHALTEWGTIEAGKRADLVLLSANPLDDIRNTTRIEGVSIGGRWLTTSECRKMVETAILHLGGGKS